MPPAKLVAQSNDRLRLVDEQGAGAGGGASPLSNSAGTAQGIDSSAVAGALDGGAVRRQFYRADVETGYAFCHPVRADLAGAL